MRSGSGWGVRNAVLIIVALSVAGCGETEQRGSPSAGAASAGGSAGTESRAGGTSGIAGSSSNIGGAASAGTNGSVAGCIDPGFGSDYPIPSDFGPPPALALHRCDLVEAEAPCVPHPLEGSIAVRTQNELSALEGVTSIEGSLGVGGDVDFDHLHCLETITGSLEIIASFQHDTSLWGLRHLKSVGSVMLATPEGRLYADCAFTQLRGKAASIEANGSVAGELDVSGLEQIGRLELSDTQVTTLSLVAGGSLSLGEIVLRNNALLYQLLMFDGASVVPLALPQEPNAGRLAITDNPYLPDCNPHRLAQAFLDAGFEPQGIVIENNYPCSSP
jgi:hypothetical protein